MNSCGWDEIGFLNYAKNHFNKNDINLLDIGANIGDFTEAFLYHFPLGNVVCLEPIPQVFKQLVVRFLPLNNVRAYNFGLHDEERMDKDFYFVKNSIGMSSLHYRPVYFPRFETEKISVTLIKLDDFPAKLPKIDYVKIDTEGSELIVLRGARRFIREHQPKFIQFEVGECYLDANITLKQVWEFLEYYNYKVVDRSFRHIPASDVIEDYDCQNYLAILKEDE